jgi:hypothetical protein
MYYLCGMEKYKKIRGHEKYSISNLGNIKSADTLLSPPVYSTGYKVVKMFNGGKYVRETVHRLVAKEFIPNLKGLPFVNHINGIKTDNRVENLEWVTNKENHIHAMNTGLKAKGESHGVSILNNSSVIEIKKLLSDGLSQRKIAAKYGVCQATIKDINLGVTWRHVS